MESFDEIVNRLYTRLRERFAFVVGSNFSDLRHCDIQDIYHEAFIAVFQNLQNGAVRPDTAWEAYIIRIGLNIASKKMRHDGITDGFSEADDPEAPGAVRNGAWKIIRDIANDEDKNLFNDPEVRAILGQELEHTPEPCHSIVLTAYFADMSMDEIARQFNYKNAATMKVVKMKCMMDLEQRMYRRCDDAGIDYKPRIRKRKNGRA